MTSQRKSRSDFTDAETGSNRDEKPTPTQKPQTDEERLFPTFARSSSGGVPIKPGSAGQTYKSKNKQNIPAGLKPIDTLSKRSRESGPVRAQGKPSRRNAGKPSSGGSLLPSEGKAQHEEQERPPKRRRRGSQDSISGKTINISDDDVVEQVIPPDDLSIPGPSSRLSPTLSQHSGRTKLWDLNSKRNSRGVSEYRDVQRNVELPRSSNRHLKRHIRFPSEDNLTEQFTENAAKERRAQSSNVHTQPNNLERSDRAPRQEIMESVEIHPHTPDEKPLGTSSPKRGVETNWKSALNSRESPDELQGDATVGPAPLSLDRKSENTNSPGEKRGRREIGQRSSPADIQPTVFTESRKTKKKKAQHPESKFSLKYFDATFLRFGDLEHVSNGATDPFKFAVEKGNGPVSINFLSQDKKVPLEKLMKILQGESPSCHARLEFLKKSTDNGVMDIIFVSRQEQETFCNLITGLCFPQVKLVGKDGEWLEKAFSRTAEETKSFFFGSKRRTENIPDKSTPTPGTIKRVKLSDSLQDSYRNTAGQKEASGTASRGTILPSSATESLDAPDPDSTQKHTSGPKQENTVEIPVKKFIPDVSSSRATRSMSRRAPATVVCDDDYDDDILPTEPEGNGKRWHKPLVYPRLGKKKAEVNANDRERLRENEFLNDNLISFYIRFLEDHLDRTNKEAAKRVYFFNSYFFSTLTNLKGKRSVNYEGVQKWTRTVDIFAFDYIVVPINEDAHWYVAIICNLPRLEGISNEGTEDVQSSKNNPTAPYTGVREIPETPEPSTNTSAATETESSQEQAGQVNKSELARQSLESISLKDTADGREGDSDNLPTEWPEQEENLAFSPAKFSSPSGKVQSDEKLDSNGAPRLPEPARKGVEGTASGKPRGPKRNINQPVIITFDSLNFTRSPTIGILRDYLYAEAKSKRGIDIDKKLIKGMKAQGNPLQRNWSDCGLYLLAYLEKFVQDPDTFIREFIKREMKEEYWPRLRSGLLRRRLRDFLDQLHDEQSLLVLGKLDGNVMADQQPINYLLGSSSDSSPNKEMQTTGAQTNPRDAKPGIQEAATDQASPTTNNVQRLKHAETSAQKMAANSEKPSDAGPEVCVQKVVDDSGAVVQVPDSQEQVQQVGSSSAGTLEGNQPRPTSSAVAELVDDSDCVYVEPDAPGKATESEKPAKNPTVEVQIIKSPTSTRENERTTKPKRKSD
ncbi:hypothetical protein BDV25DRAFT_154908 [Aspergillus avenaceus]|uniref:Ubiquitin-like protease family profile domain-containing protein n=1 Tax=Aspergillus avenaceus TaxID=36643 RepID=A0A5N6TVT8_ASPAV|nr:hypothetical protein BDV25DRAFT_154908 [Aspergillus avenaceus]